MNNGLINRPKYVKKKHIYKNVMFYWYCSHDILSVNVKEVCISQDDNVFKKKNECKELIRKAFLLELILL